MKRFTLHQYAKFTAFAAACLIFAGGLVTSTGSGLSVPDWPLSFGTLFPPMKGGVRFEHGHRMAAGTVVILTAFLVIWIFRACSRTALKGLAAAAMAAVLLQAVLGGTTVLLKLPPAVSVAHAGLAQIFFCLIVSLAVVSAPGWESPRRLYDRGFPSLRFLSAAAVLVVYTQVILGAVMRHIGAGLIIPDFPLAFGKLIPPRAAFTFPVGVHYAHRAWALVTAFFVIWTAARAFKTQAPVLRKIAAISLILLAVQTTLGGLTILTRKAVIPTTLHVLVGALLLGTQAALFLHAARLIRAPSSSLVAQPASS